MSLKDLKLLSSYETENDKEHLLEEFYIPLLEQSTKYYRIAGFFSSTALAVASKGIEGLIHNGGRMYLLISPVLSEEDFEVIRRHGKLNEDATLFSDLKLDGVVNENLQALAWLLDNDLLRIKIVVPTEKRDSLFHQKIGIAFDDKNDMVSFSGSINETAQAWLYNIEEFKVFKSWEQGQMEYLQSDLEKFLNYWKGNKKDIATVFDLPEAIKERIIKVNPRDVKDLNIMRRYKKDSKLNSNKLSLFPHQKEAVKAWKENGYSLLMEMATGTGKTRTAIGCLVSKLPEKESMLVIVATPQNTLSRQWQLDFDELEIKLDRSAIIDGSNPKWKKDLEMLLIDMVNKPERNRTAIIFTTHETASNEKFTNIILNNKHSTKIMFICDEVHAIGSKEQRKALLPCYDYRIGLSATPERMFDEGGTSLIRDYFGNKSFEFTIANALNTINPLTGRPFLNPYEYHPVFVLLTDSEMSKYQYYSKKIAILRSKDDYDEDELQRLYDRRANICKNAENKTDAFSNLIDLLNPETLTDTIVFVSDKQIQPVFEILTSKKIKRAKITESESATKKVNTEGETERQEIISQFKRQQLQVLVGIKCLDEGIDIKNARIAVLMSSSTNPREYIQRVGRVIRPAVGKGVSKIYDIIVESPNGTGDGILEKEARRASLIANNAVNYEQARESFRKHGVDLNAD